MLVSEASNADIETAILRMKTVIELGLFLCVRVCYEIHSLTYDIFVHVTVILSHVYDE